MTPTTTPTVGSTLADEGVLIVRARRHLIRPGTTKTVCGRYDTATWPTERMEQRVAPGLALVCGVCRDVAKANGIDVA